jgi:hypothetical protein
MWYLTAADSNGIHHAIYFPAEETFLGDEFEEEYGWYTACGGVAIVTILEWPYEAGFSCTTCIDHLVADKQSVLGEPPI